MINSMIGAIDPVAFNLFGIEVRWYGVIIAVGILIALTLADREAQRLGFSEDFIIDAALWIVPIGFIGARLYYVIFQWDYYVQHPQEIIAIWQGGLGIYGGIIAGAIALIAYARYKKSPAWLVLDILAPSLMIAQAIGRWGNFANQEAHGGEVTRQFLEQTLMLPNFIVEQMHINGAYYHPTFLYESVWNLIGFIIILILRKQKKFYRRGEVVLSYVIWYAVGRFFIEGMRTDSLYIGSTDIRISQVVSIVAFIGAIAFWIYRRFYLYPPAPYYNEGLQPEKEFARKKEEYERQQGRGSSR